MIKPTTGAADPVVQRAIEWMVQLHSGEMTPDERLAFEKWRAQNLYHEQACRQIERTLGAVPLLASEPTLRKTLTTSGNRRQFLQKTIAVAAFATTAGWLYDRQSPIEGLIADLHTGTGERTTRQLDDGTRLTLNARSSVDVNITDSSRQIHLLKGQIYVEAQAARTPLVIRTSEGQISLGNGSLTVALRPEGTRIVALSQNSALRNLSNHEALLVARHSVLMNATGFSPLRIGADAERAWLDGNFEINDQPLIVLIDALRDYRTGILRVSADAARMRICGIFPLDNTDYALESLAQTAPLVITRITPYLVTISRA